MSGTGVADSICYFWFLEEGNQGVKILSRLGEACYRAISAASPLLDRTRSREPYPHAGAPGQIEADDTCNASGELARQPQAEDAAMGMGMTVV